MNLTKILAKNYFTCARSMGMGNDEPVKSGVAAMKHRVGLIKLGHQADWLGLVFDSETPWIFRPKDHLLRRRSNDDDATAGKSAAGSTVPYGCLADLVPDNPSDWIPFDRLMANPPHPGGMRSNTEYENYGLESSTDRSVTPVARACPIELGLVDGSNTDREAIIGELDEEAVQQPTDKQPQDYDSSCKLDNVRSTVPTHNNSESIQY